MNMMTEPAIIKLAQALAELVRPPGDAAPPAVTTARYVTIALASAKTGLSEKAIRRKVESGVWLEGREWTRGIDGHIYIDMEGYDRWVGKAVGSRNARTVSV
ncbi:hypothetical protein ACIPF8_19210 [Collimonas sp. NPDC087041]|uniref:hypothetical protein n=1 Tax=Collimonas sp. NPDC087041 TaxID=3363960 RepID=UPI00380FD865